MLTENSVHRIVKSVVDSIGVEKASDLTKEQLSEIISKSIYEVLTSKDFSDQVSNDLAMRSRGRR